MRPVILALILALVVPSLAPAATSQEAGGAFRLLVRGVAADFAPEKWKEEQPLTGNLSKTGPLPAVPNLIGTYRNPYYDGRPRQLPAGPVNAWGYSLNLSLELGDANRQPVNAPTTPLTIEAWIEAGQHDIPAKLTKTGATSFRAQFDLDGELGKPWPALLGGSLPVMVEVYENPATSQPRKVGQDSVAIRSTYGVGSLAAVAFPREALTVYSDLGNFTSLATRALAPADTLSVSFSFGVPDAPARGVLVNTRAQKVVFEGKTDSAGTLMITAKPSDVLGAAEGGLVVVEAHLVGSAADLTVGNGLVVVPVQSHATTVTGMAQETRVGTADPAATVKIIVSDPDAGPQTGGRQGRVVALDGVRVLANVPFLPVEPGGDLNHKVARYPAAFVTGATPPPSSYNVFSLLFTERNEFYSLATATRGISISAAPAQVQDGVAGSLRLTIRNLNENGDTTADPGLGATAHVRVDRLPGGGNWTGDVALYEGEVRVLPIEFGGARPGVYEAVVNSTFDELRVDRVARVVVSEPRSALDGFLERLTPAPAALGLLALAALAALAGRRPL